MSRNIMDLKEKMLFQVVYLKNDKYQSTLVDEVEEIDFSAIRRHLERGESVFITSREAQKLGISMENRTTAAISRNQLRQRLRTAIPASCTSWL